MLIFVFKENDYQFRAFNLHSKVNKLLLFHHSQSSEMYHQDLDY
jgi:hypothetical protein